MSDSLQMGNRDPYWTKVRAGMRLAWKAGCFRWHPYTGDNVMEALQGTCAAAYLLLFPLWNLIRVPLLAARILINVRALRLEQLEKGIERFTRRGK